MQDSRSDSPPAPAPDATPLLRNKLFWVGILYFAEGFPLGVFYEIFPVYFRQQGVELRQIGVLSLLGLAWTLKFLWAPAVDYWRHHRRWMATVDVGMGLVMLYFAMQAGFGPLVWIAIGTFTVLSATNDVAIDGYTIEFLEKQELGLANGIRIGLYRVGMLASGFILMASDWLSWHGAFVVAAVVFFGLAVTSLVAPRERVIVADRGDVGAEIAALSRSPFALAVLARVRARRRVADRQRRRNGRRRRRCSGCTWPPARRSSSASSQRWVARDVPRPPIRSTPDDALTRGPMFGALMELLRRPAIVPVLVFILIFKLPDSAMGFMVKPFWVDAGFSAAQIGLVSVNIGLVLSIAGGFAGGWITDRIGIYRALWILGLAQAASNLGYWIAASVMPIPPAGGVVPFEHQAMLYAASATESFTGGLGTAAFLAFLMAIVQKERAATEYALLSSVFALSRSVAGWVGGIGASSMGYANWFLLTFFLAFPAYLLLPWVSRMLRGGDTAAAARRAPPAG